MTDRSTAHILEFTAPFDVETCQQRLQHRHESMRFFAWDWQRRTWVKTRWRDAHTCQFILKRVEKNDFFGIGSLGVVRGYLRRLDNNQTVILAERHIAWLWIITPLIIIGLTLVSIMLGASAAPETTPRAIIIWAGIMTPIVIGSTIFSWWWAHEQAQFLIGTIKEALGIWE